MRGLKGRHVKKTLVTVWHALGLISSLGAHGCMPVAAMTLKISFLNGLNIEIDEHAETLLEKKCSGRNNRDSVWLDTRHPLNLYIDFNTKA